jgi:flavin reductase (DIM6/NTAB) family NADH-FMN oxidoreductase RutF
VRKPPRQPHGAHLFLISRRAGGRRYAALHANCIGAAMTTSAETDSAGFDTAGLAPAGFDTAGFDTDYFRAALSQFATGITIVITRSPEGNLHGLTVNSFNSVSLEPPLVLWSLSTRARCMVAFSAASHYIINVLAANQLDLALRFSQDVADRFEDLDYAASPAGLPILPGVAAWFECRNRSRYLEGDHVIFVGEVERCHVNPTQPLGFYGGKFIAI